MNIDVMLPYCVPLAFLLLFFLAFRLNRASLMPGILLSISLLSLLGIVFVQAYASNDPAAAIFLALTLGLFILLAAFGAYIFVAFLAINTFAILRKERRSLKHSLTLVLAVIVLLVTLAPHALNSDNLPYILLMAAYSAHGLVIYYLLHLTQFAISMILCNLSRPSLNQDYIIVLGCRVSEGRVTPMLARRMDKAIAFYSRQKAVGMPPKLVLSGGKGPDEACAEAEAMRDYALERGIPDSDLLIEVRSASTLENMVFSKEIMDGDSAGKPYRCIYATNNYHVLRAGIYARKAGLKISGIGAKTKFYYLPNAILREYIAYLVIHLKWNIAFSAISMVFGTFLLPAILIWLS